jgi:pimeloyl-ACP methyl ester carboxylesterase
VIDCGANGEGRHADGQGGEGGDADAVRTCGVRRLGVVASGRAVGGVMVSGFACSFRRWVLVVAGRRGLPVGLLVCLLLAAPGSRAVAGRWYYRLTAEDRVIGEQVLILPEESAAEGGPLAVVSRELLLFEAPPRIAETTVIYSRASRRVVQVRRRVTVGRVEEEEKLEISGNRWFRLSHHPPWPPLRFEDALPNAPWGVLFPESIASLQSLGMALSEAGESGDRLQLLLPGQVVDARIIRGDERKERISYRVLGGPLRLKLFVDQLSGVVERVRGLDGKRRLERIPNGEALPKALRPPVPDYVETKALHVPAAGGEMLSGRLKLPRDTELPPLLLMIDDLNPEDPLGRGLFADIGNALAKRGIATAMYYHQGIGESTGEFSFLGLDDAFRDAEEVLNALNLRADIDTRRVAVLGYGIGGLLALQLAARHPELRAVVTLAACAEAPFPDLLRSSYRHRAEVEHWDRSRLQRALRAIEWAEEQVERASGDWVVVEGESFPVPFACSCRNFSLAQRLEGLETPVLLLHGTADERFPVTQLDILEKALRELGLETLEARRLDGLNHDLGPWMSIERTYPAAPYRYAQPTLKRRIETWLEEHLL